jgi:hypothetical protein
VQFALTVPCIRDRVVQTAAKLNRSTAEAGQSGSAFHLPECLESGSNFRFLIQVGQLIRPGAVAVQMSAYIRH